MLIVIGQRRAPSPNNQPGYLRVDSVHQGDQDGIKGVYHINIVDCVTQFEGVATCERISEAFLIPVLDALLDSFPFVVKGFHSDNGSEYVHFRWRPQLRDPGDELVLEAAVNGRAEILVTHNVCDFAGVSKQFALAVLTPQQFLQETQS